MKLLYCMLLFLCPYVSNAQALSVGDTIPAKVWQYILKSPVFNPITTSLDNKIIVLDFMATNCSACIKKLPELDSLQAQYGNKIQVILVSNQKPVHFTRLMSREPYANLKLPVICNDTLLAALFPHQYLSHVVWIKAGRKVTAITHAHYVRPVTIDAMLAGTRTQWPVKNDFTSYNKRQPLLAMNMENVGEESLPAQQQYSSFTAYLPNVVQQYNTRWDSLGNTLKFTLVNMGLADMLLHLPGMRHFEKSQVLLRVPHKKQYVFDPATDLREDWHAAHGHCYEAVFSKEVDTARRQQKMLDDLAWYFGVSISVQKMTRPAWVLTDADSSLQIPWLRKNSRGNDVPLANILYQWNNRYNEMPMLDKRANKRRLYLLPGLPFNNIPQLQKLLPAYGLELKMQTEEMMMLVVTGK